MSNVSNVVDYIGYFRQLAVSHKDLQHNTASETGDAPIGSQHFTKVSVDEVVSGLRTKMGWPALLLELYEVETDSAVVYDIKQRPKGAFMVLAHPANDSFAAEVDCYQKAEQIVIDLLRKMWQDHYGVGKDACGTPFRRLSFDKLSITPVGPLFDKEFGYRVEFEFELQNGYDLTKAPENGVFL